MTIKKIFAGIAAVFLAVPNAVLTTICFYALIGSLLYIFGAEWSHSVQFWTAATIAIGLTVGEAFVHMDNKDKGTNAMRWIAIMLFVVINVFAGNYRVAESQRQARMDARQLAINDPRWTALDESQKSYEAMNHNRFSGDDAEASAGLERIAKERNSLVQEYVTDSHVAADSGGFAGIGSHWLLNLLWVAINLLYGLAIRVCYEGSDELEETKPFLKPGFYFSRTPLRAGYEKVFASKTSPKTADAVAAQDEETPPKKQVGFHASFDTRERDLQTLKPQQIKSGNLTLAPRAEYRQPSTKPVNVDVNVDKKPQPVDTSDNRSGDGFTAREWAIIRACMDNKHPAGSRFAGRPKFSDVAKMFPKEGGEVISRQYVEKLWKRYEEMAG